jgi:hypothetical protein
MYLTLRFTCATVLMLAMKSFVLANCEPEREFHNSKLSLETGEFRLEVGAPLPVIAIFTVDQRQQGWSSCSQENLEDQILRSAR